jgi:hypothetical protein
MLNGYGSDDMLGLHLPDDLDDAEETDWCTGTADFHGQGIYDGI